MATKKRTTKSTAKKSTRAARPAYKVYRLKSWGEYLELVNSEQYRSWAFRGQGDARWQVWSTLPRFLQRHGVHEEHWRHQERRSINKFQRKAHHFLKHVPHDEDTLQWLALMQHHGAPTRLLDFTWSPYVAAFFALQDATEAVAVWAINGDEITWGQLFRTDEDRDRLDPRIRGNLDAMYLAEDSNRVYVGEPKRQNERLIAQSGTFAVPGTIHQPLDRILAKYPSPRRTIAKFVLPPKLRRRAIEDLKKMNILNATLFPGLDGLARSISYDLEFHWAWDVTKKGRRPPR